MPPWLDLSTTVEKQAGEKMTPFAKIALNWNWGIPVTKITERKLGFIYEKPAVRKLEKNHTVDP
jgi:hypothetical protein